MEGTHALAKTDPAELEKRFGHLPKNIGTELPPEEQKKILLQYKSLPKEERKKIWRALQKGCSNCEKEFGLPKIAISHGICIRHKAEYYSQMKVPMPPSANSPVPDLKDYSPEELKLLEALAGILISKRKEKAKSKPGYTTVG